MRPAVSSVAIRLSVAVRPRVADTNFGQTDFRHLGSGIRTCAATLPAERASPRPLTGLTNNGNRDKLRERFTSIDPPVATPPYFGSACASRRSRHAWSVAIRAAKALPIYQPIPLLKNVAGAVVRLNDLPTPVQVDHANLCVIEQSRQ